MSFVDIEQFKVFQVLKDSRSEDEIHLTMVKIFNTSKIKFKS